ncbi:Spherulation-specific family 4 [Dendryphion nanum]|uniref:Spherulation-specific family 4 n=1 Tax=Dendryphion nanum TaxID=256645 RepID=A0A9P9DBC9_9PLEO|nr:Spherulation-specific family 4 [Dendryphion nanum]
MSHQKPTIPKPVFQRPAITIISPSRSEISLATNPYAPPRQPPRRPPPRQKIDDRTLALTVTFILTVLIAIGLPLGIVLPQKFVRQLPVNVLIPLYSSPVLGTWEPLNDIFIKHSDTIFTAIISLSSGPGTPPYPNAPQIAAISKLKAHSNVRVVGYIDINYGMRDSKSVIDEIKTYAGWSNHSNSRLALQGLLFDRTPATDSLQAREYLVNISAIAKHSDGFLSPMILIHNPGRVPDTNMTNSYVDMTVVFEGAYEMLPTHESTKKALSSLRGDRDSYAFMVHSTPTGVENARLRRMINSVRKDVIVKAYPALKWVVIVNPINGPGGPPWWPNEDYVREIPRLNAEPNVTTIGYIRIDYCRRPIEEVYEDIKTYADRATDPQFPGLGLEGIFVDETPNHHTEEFKNYLDAVDRYIKGIDGILGDRIVIHNPGTAVHAGLADPGPDLTTIIEEGWPRYQTKEYQNWLATSPYDRTRTCAMMNAVPKDDVPEVTRMIRDRAEYVFVTDLDENFYESFGPSWDSFVEAMAQK